MREIINKLNEMSAMNGELKDYAFLNEVNKDEKILTLSFGGSHAYGTNTESSDIDVRGIKLGSQDSLIGLNKAKLSGLQFTDNGTDTVIYNLDKAFTLLTKCNPNSIDLLFQDKNNFLYISEEGKAIINKRNIFLNKRLYESFKGFGEDQLDRLNAILAIKNGSEADMYKIAKGRLQKKINDIAFETNNNFMIDVDDELNIKIIKTENISYNVIKQYINELDSLVKNAKNIGHRTNHVFEKGEKQISKHAMHTIRPYYIGIDLLEKHDTDVKRYEEHDILMSILNGEMQNKDGTFNDQFSRLRNELEKRFEKAYRNTTLPDKADEVEINKLYKNIVLWNIR